MNKKIVLFDIDYTIFDTDNFKNSDLTDFRLYDEVSDLLKTLISRNYEIGIFSQGEVDFQINKLKNTGIIDMFGEERLHIYQDKIENTIEVVNRYKKHNIFIVDDKLEVLHNAKKANDSIVTVWIKRGPFLDSYKEEFIPDHTLMKLDELLNIIN